MPLPFPAVLDTDQDIYDALCQCNLVKLTLVSREVDLYDSSELRHSGTLLSLCTDSSTAENKSQHNSTNENKQQNSTFDIIGKAFLERVYCSQINFLKKFPLFDVIVGLRSCHHPIRDLGANGNIVGWRNLSRGQSLDYSCTETR